MVAKYSDVSDVHVKIGPAIFFEILELFECMEGEVAKCGRRGCTVLPKRGCPRRGQIVAKEGGREVGGGGGNVSQKSEKKNKFSFSFLFIHTIS